VRPPVILLIFWGCIAMSIVLSAWGVGRRSTRLLFLAALFAVPLTFYLVATPRFRWVGLLLPVPQLMAGIVVKRSRPLAILLASAFPCFVVWLETIVIMSNATAWHVQPSH
jgi:hypothetical protein